MLIKLRRNFNYMLEIDILRNYFPKHLCVLRGYFWGFGCPKDAQMSLWLRICYYYYYHESMTTTTTTLFILSLSLPRLPHYPTPLTQAPMNGNSLTGFEFHFSTTLRTGTGSHPMTAMPSTDTLEARLEPMLRIVP